MIYESSIGNLDFWTPYEDRLNTFTKIGINLSAGTDSALVLYMTCRELVDKPHVTIIPVTGVDVLRPTNEWNAKEIVMLMKEWFPTVRFGEHQINKYRKLNPSDKTRNHVEHENKLRDEGIIDVLFHGRTANPPEDVAKKHDLLSDRETRRDVYGNTRIPYHENHGKPFYCPMEYLDKRFVAEQYHKFNLMEDLFPITASCIAHANETDYFTKPCKSCWWCREKKWAFGMYDGGVSG